jgi:putative membrane protein
MELKYFIASIIYSFLGIIILGISFWIFDKITPGTLWKELIEDQNTALAIVFAAFMIAIAIIIGSAINS